MGRGYVLRSSWLQTRSGPVQAKTPWNAVTAWAGGAVRFNSREDLCGSIRVSRTQSDLSLESARWDGRGAEVAESWHAETAAR